MAGPSRSGTSAPRRTAEKEAFSPQMRSPGSELLGTSCSLLKKPLPTLSADRQAQAPIKRHLRHCPASSPPRWRAKSCSLLVATAPFVVGACRSTPLGRSRASRLNAPPYACPLLTGGAELHFFCSIEINSTSKIKVAFGPISRPAPLSP